MSELDLFNTQNELYIIVKKFLDERNVPSVLQKMILEGIYSRIQNDALTYITELQLQTAQQKEQVSEGPRGFTGTIDMRDMSTENVE